MPFGLDINNETSLDLILEVLCNEMRSNKDNYRIGDYTVIYSYNGCIIKDSHDNFLSCDYYWDSDMEFNITGLIQSDMNNDELIKMIHDMKHSLKEQLNKHESNVMCIDFILTSVTVILTYALSYWICDY